MQRMPGVDAGYFYMETAALHMHTLKIAVLDPPDGYHFDMLREELGRRLQMDQARPITADGFEPVETESALQNYV